jgi:hypothetical protein
MRPKIERTAVWEGSWADEEFKKTHRPITRVNVFNGKTEVIGYEKIHLTRPDWHGKPSILIPGFENAVSLGPIDPKYARIFNG